MNVVIGVVITVVVVGFLAWRYHLARKNAPKNRPSVKEIVDQFDSVE